MPVPDRDIDNPMLEFAGSDNPRDRVEGYYVWEEYDCDPFEPDDRNPIPGRDD